jgi:hypothetical protein
MASALISVESARGAAGGLAATPVNVEDGIEILRYQPRAW